MKTLLFMEKPSEDWKIMSFLQLLIQMLLYLFYLLPHKYIMTVLGNQAALNCDVYYLIDKEVKNIGTIESMGTAYPIAYDETGIYAASGHDMQRFEIEKSGSLRLAEGIYEQFDESGNAAYTMKKGEETDVITEEEYYAAFEKYSNATIVNFSYGASDAGKAEVVTNNELEPRQGNIAEDVNVLEIVQETASEFAVKKMETSYF